MNRTRKPAARPARKTTKRSPATPRAKKAKKELTAIETAMIAWQDTWAKRHKRMN